MLWLADLSTRALVALVVAFLGVLAVFTALTLTDNDPGVFLAFLGNLLVLAGVGAHHEVRTRQQNAVIAKIDRQTNGILTERIEKGSRKAVRDVLRSIGYSVPDGD